MSHTPGPWEVVKDGMGSEWVACSEAPDLITEARYAFVASVVSLPQFLYRHGVERETGGLAEASDNARLIAAAPDLLDAAATLLGELDRWEVPQENEAGEFEAVERLRRAIDKATGVRV